MAIPHAAPGEVIELKPAGPLTRDDSQTLIRTTHLEVFRYVLPAGKETVEHTAAGTMVLQCLEGRVEVRAGAISRTLAAGTMLYLPDAEPHAVKAVEASLLIVTLLLHRE